LAVFLFDYRYFGDSDGHPRHIINHVSQLQDWKAAVTHVRGLSEVDSDRLALFGSSFSGGHVIVTASRDPGISAVVAQVPFVDAWSSMGKMNPLDVVKAMLFGVRDLFRMLMGREPLYVPIVGDPGTYAFMNTPDARPGYLALVPAASSWENKAAARLALTIGSYRPVKAAHRVSCPALILLAEEESLISVRMTERTVEKMPRGELVRLPCGHFDPYVGKRFEEVVAIESEFLVKHLKARP
jgi:pimeloyl-ACP methyl ester carboxylesterase